ncbi:MAG: molybdopterin-dependent oxidoreductase, partial [Dehalococcoidia bacterium]|nr:molybdopterin-dependent oxidoreductase [Dehalococcoidia bacterium]
MSGNTISYKKGFCAQCVSLCPIICQVENGRLTRIIADKEHPNANDLCPKGLAGPELVYNSQRLRHPMRRTNPKDDPDPGWQPITWEEALDSIAGKLKDIKEQFGPECVAFSRPGVGSSPASLFDDYVSRLAYAFGTPNTLSTTHICQWNRDSGSKYTYGLQPTAKPEFKNTRCIVLWGHNPYATARDYVREIRNALRRGVKLVVVDPRRTEAADRAHLWLQPRPGTDGSLILGMLNVIINEDLFDKEFVTKWTNAPFLVRRDTGKLLDTADVSGKFSPGNYVVWDPVENNPQAYRIDTRNYGKADIIPTLFGSC